ncbi:MAG: J domain-containing protein, partial [Chloroflexota bacterium]|nr:J domain-containing protein [Chloroflexota bacterium]
VLGITLRVPTLDKAIDVTVPPGTQPDMVLRVRGKGLPFFGRSGRGDLYVRILIHVPDKLGREERELYEHIRTLQSNGKHQHWFAKAGVVEG